MVPASAGCFMAENVNVHCEDAGDSCLSGLYTVGDGTCLGANVCEASDVNSTWDDNSWTSQDLREPTRA